MFSFYRRADGLKWLFPLLLAGGFGLPTAEAADADHLILSEVVVDSRLTSIQIGSKFIEIHNPTDEGIDLSTVYLTDATTQPTNFYYKIVLGENAGGGTAGDFHCRFPPGTTIAPGDTLVVSIAGSTEYEAAYGRLPDFELFEDNFIPDSVPEMTEVFPSSIGAGLGSANSNNPDLNNATETVVLYQWDGQSDLVQDLDYLIWGTSSNVRVDKTRVSIDGPDGDDNPSTYADDTPIVSQDPVNPSGSSTVNRSFMRQSADEGNEVTSAGNGLTGHNETSEDLGTTWLVTPQGGQDPPALSPTSFPPAPIFDFVGVSSGVPREGEEITVTADLLYYTGNPVASATLYYSIDGGNFTDVDASDNGDDSWSGVIPAQTTDTVVSWYYRAVGDSGGVAVYPSGAPHYTEVFTITSGGLVHPVFTEVCVVGEGQEFIEIYNPHSVSIDLSTFYLTDAVYSPGGTLYWQIVRPNPSQDTVGGGAFADFHAKFPADASLAPGDTIVVSIADGNSFAQEYGFFPDFQMYGSGTSSVSTMEPVFEGPDGDSIVGETDPTLSNSGESIILYMWDGQTDLVTDVDVFVWGSADTYRFSKTGVVIDGPDPDVEPSAYADETAVADQTPITLESVFGESYQRISDEGDEIGANSNGIEGHDEVSEPWADSWVIAERTPSAPSIPEVESEVKLVVPPRTFLPLMGETFKIRFTSQPRSETRLRIFDMEGRLVIVLFDNRFDGPPAVIPGQFTEVPWNGRDSQFELVPAGMYVVHLSVVDNRTGKEEIKQAPAVVATRLSK